jgi:hypothetical protein
MNNEARPFQTFSVRTLSFVARHKDPFFEDEREAPIVAVPHKEADARVFGMGPAFRKPVKVMRDGRHYIVLEFVLATRAWTHGHTAWDQRSDLR